MIKWELGWICRLITMACRVSRSHRICGCPIRAFSEPTNGYEHIFYVATRPFIVPSNTNKLFDYHGYVKSAGTGLQRMNTKPPYQHTPATQSQPHHTQARKLLLPVTNFATCNCMKLLNSYPFLSVFAFLLCFSSPPPLILFLFPSPPALQPA